MAAKSTTLQILFTKRMLFALLTGFASGLPLLLTGGTLQAWLKDQQVSIKEIGLFALVGLPYTVKFLWSPALDRFTLPFLGRRRGWMLVIQFALIALIAGLGLAGATGSPWVIALVALAVTFTSASQDIVLDAYRRESFPEEEQGAAASLFINGYRLAMLVAGALALFLADHMPWSMVYFIMAAAMLVGVFATLLCPEPPIREHAPRSLREAVVGPFREFFQRREAWLVLLFILTFKLGDQLASAMSTPFVLDIGFSKTELAAAFKVFGMAAAIAGGFVGAPLIIRWGPTRSLWIFGIIQAVGILAFVALAHGGRVWPLLALAVAVEQFTASLGTAAYTGFMASQTNRRFTATQYALFSSLMGVPRVFLAAPTGYIAEKLGWTGYFVFCVVCAIPGLLLLMRVAPWSKAQPRDVPPAAAV